ncbi:MAG TPA: hypothetical protein VG275_07075 [Solirubrobacteraceae bacterium]|jgi:hypothetical protein|nr:hypothetical protein [Solirubrobacteraceae bacterium]
MKRLVLLLCVLAPALALTACGGSSQPTTALRSAPPVPGCDPPVGQGHLGACIAHPPQLRRVTPPVTLTRSERQIPDVYEGTGCGIDWALASRFIVGAIYKTYEAGYRQDACALRNTAALNALHLWHTSYVFDRNIGSCDQIAASYVEASGGLAFFERSDVGDPVIDAEVPSAAANLSCLASRIHTLTGRQVLIYSGSGTFPGGISMAGRPEWDAAFGPVPGSFGSGGVRVAWQHTGGGFVGPGPHSVPGIPGASIDMSLDEGITSEHYVAPHPVCFGPRAQLRNATCKRIRPQVSRWSRARAATGRALKRSSCRTPYRRSICTRLGQRYRWFDGRARTTVRAYS